MLKLAAQTEPGMLQVVAMGIITVFIVLVCLIAIIKLLGLIMGKAAGAKPAAPQPAAPAPAAAPAAQGDKGRLVAAMAAAIAEDMGTDVDHIRIHSIRRV